MSKIVAISVTSTNGFDSSIDQRFGRCHSFLIVDLAKRTILAQLENNAAQASHGAGTGAAAIMSSNNVGVVISGAYGPKAFQALEQLGIEIMKVPENVSPMEALDKLEAGELDRMGLKVY